MYVTKKSTFQKLHPRERESKKFENVPPDYEKKK
jgi:hypothetical protein